MQRMFFFFLRFTHLFLVTSFLLFSSFGLNADAKKIKILGNERISDETIILLSGLSDPTKISSDDINEALKKITKSGLFSDIKISHQDSKSYFSNFTFMQNEFIFENWVYNWKNYSLAIAIESNFHGN